MAGRSGSDGRRYGGYTLLELMIVLVLMGIASALVIPNVGGSVPIRVQTAVRAVAADIMYAQGDAIAYQARRAIVFDPASNSYWIAEVSGDTLDYNTDAMYRIDGPDQRFKVDLDTVSRGAAQMISANFDGDEILVFDELGGPVAGLDSDEPSVGGEIVIGGDDGLLYQLSVEAYSGRVTVQKIGG
ncbi:MAG TPA: type II secretion system protein [Phycisphaerales bacterium]|nr:type II secretion system protein [Phycisphaerales bacterium]